MIAVVLLQISRSRGTRVSQNIVSFGGIDINWCIYKLLWQHRPSVVLIKYTQYMMPPMLPVQSISMRQISLCKAITAYAITPPPLWKGNHYIYCFVIWTTTKHWWYQQR